MVSTDGKKRKTVKPVTDDVTVLKVGSIGKGIEGRQISSSRVSDFRAIKFDLFDIFSNLVTNAINRQKKANSNYLKIDFEFDLIRRSITVSEQSTGLSKEDFVAIPLDAKFRIHYTEPEFNSNFSILEFATYFGNSLEVLNVTADETNWIHINIKDMINTERVDVVKDKNVDNEDAVNELIKGTGLKFHVEEVPYEFERGWTLIPSPEELDRLREKLAINFSDIMQEFDLIIRLYYKAKMVSDYSDKDTQDSLPSEKKEKKFFFWRKRKK